MENCILCGSPLNEEGRCPVEHKFKKMCLNCMHVDRNSNGELVCTNEKNLAEAVKKVMSAVPNGYELDESTIKLNPLPLKKPTLKCGEWYVSTEAVNYIFEHNFE